MFFKPVVATLKQVAMITAKNYPNKNERAQKLRLTLVKIGEFIRNTLDGQQSMPSLEVRLWYVLLNAPSSPTSRSNLDYRDHVSLNYWPNKDASGAKLQLMFNKVMEASKASKPANGTSA